MGIARKNTLAGQIRKVGKALGITNQEALKLQLIVAVELQTKKVVMITEDYLSKILPQVRN